MRCIRLRLRFFDGPSIASAIAAAGDLGETNIAGIPLVLHAVEVLHEMEGTDVAKCFKGLAFLGMADRKAREHFVKNYIRRRGFSVESLRDVVVGCSTLRDDGLLLRILQTICQAGNLAEECDDCASAAEAAADTVRILTQSYSSPEVVPSGPVDGSHKKWDPVALNGAITGILLQLLRLVPQMNEEELGAISAECMRIPDGQLQEQYARGILNATEYRLRQGGGGDRNAASSVMHFLFSHVHRTGALFATTKDHIARCLECAQKLYQKIADGVEELLPEGLIYALRSCQVLTQLMQSSTAAAAPASQLFPGGFPQLISPFAASYCQRTAQYSASQVLAVANVLVKEGLMQHDILRASMQRLGSAMEELSVYELISLSGILQKMCVCGILGNAVSPKLVEELGAHISLCEAYLDSDQLVELLEMWCDIQPQSQVARSLLSTICKSSFQYFVILNLEKQPQEGDKEASKRVVLPAHLARALKCCAAKMDHLLDLAVHPLRECGELVALYLKEATKAISETSSANQEQKIGAADGSAQHFSTAEAVLVVAAWSLCSPSHRSVEVEIASFLCAALPTISSTQLLTVAISLGRTAQSTTRRCWLPQDPKFWSLLQVSLTVILPRLPLVHLVALGGAIATIRSNASPSFIMDFPSGSLSDAFRQRLLSLLSSETTDAIRASSVSHLVHIFACAAEFCASDAGSPVVQDCLLRVAECLAAHTSEMSFSQCVALLHSLCRLPFLLHKALCLGAAARLCGMAHKLAGAEVVSLCSSLAHCISHHSNESGKDALSVLEVGRLFGRPLAVRAMYLAGCLTPEQSQSLVRALEALHSQCGVEEASSACHNILQHSTSAK